MSTQGGSKRKRADQVDSAESPSKKPTSKKPKTEKVNKEDKKTSETKITPSQPKILRTGIGAALANNLEFAELIGPEAILRQYNVMGGFTIRNAPITIEEMRSLGNFQQGLTPDAVSLVENYIRNRDGSIATAQPLGQIQTPVGQNGKTSTSTIATGRVERIAAALQQLDRSDFSKPHYQRVLSLAFRKWKADQGSKGLAAQLLEAIRVAYAAAVTQGNIGACSRLQAAEKVLEKELERIIKN